MQVIFSPDIEIDPTEILQSKPQEFKLPPHGTSKDSDFDPTVHMELEPEKDPNAEGEEGEEDDDLNMSFDSQGNPKKKEIVFKLTVPTLYNHWLYISPTKDEIQQTLQDIIA